MFWHTVNEGTRQAVQSDEQMEVHGTISANLAAAVRSARRLRGHPVYKDTLTRWADLVHQARRELAAGLLEQPGELEELVAQLDAELARRKNRDVQM